MQGLQVAGSKSAVKPLGEFQSWDPHGLHLLRRRLGLLWRKGCEEVRAERPLQKSRQEVMAGSGWLRPAGNHLHFREALDLVLGETKVVGLKPLTFLKIIEDPKEHF